MSDTRCHDHINLTEQKCACVPCLRARVAELEGALRDLVRVNDEWNARLRAERAFLDDTLLKHRIYCDDGMGYDPLGEPSDRGAGAAG